MLHPDEQAVIDLETARCEAISKGDLTALGDCLTEDYMHVGGAGGVSTKQGYLATIGGSPRAPERTNLKARVYGNAAVLTGDLLNKIGAPGEPVKIVETFVTQVAIRNENKWRFVSFQLTQKRKP